MYLINHYFDVESNYIIGAIVGLVTAAISVLMVVLAAKFKSKKLGAPIVSFAVICALCMVASSLFCYNELVIIGYLASVICLAAVLALICQVYHQNTIYNVLFTNLFLRFLMPISVIGLMFRPWFSEYEGSWYTLFPGLGMNVDGTYVYDVTVLTNDVKNPVTWNIISIVEILLFIAVVAMQIIMIWREFADPDNASSWAFIGLFVTVLGTAFIYGVYTSPNFRIATTMSLETVREFDMSTGVFSTYEAFKPVESNTAIVTAVPFVTAICGVVTWILHFESVENFIENIRSFPKKLAGKKAKNA